MTERAAIAPSSIPRCLGLWVGANFSGGFVVGLLENNGLAQGWLLQRHGRSPWGWLLVSLLGAACQGAVSAALCAALCPLLRG